MFNYFPPHTGSIQNFTATNAGTYKLEVWGAQGGTDSSDEITIGKGGYAKGNLKSDLNQILYICVGGQGGPTMSTGSGGYNGGGFGGLYSGSTTTRAGGGGGATHIASASGLLSALSSKTNSVYIVAAGGGGYCHGGDVTDKHYGGSGGGTNGGNSVEPYNTGKISYGATQTSGYLFGKGQDGRNSDGGSFGAEAGGGCGGGWYGGTASQYMGNNSNTGGSGGSGHLGSMLSDVTMQPGVRNGNGYAIITQISF